jgi:hypothetical protein
VADLNGWLLGLVKSLALYCAKVAHGHLDLSMLHNGPKRAGMVRRRRTRDEGETYETVKCLACDQLVSRSTGRTLGNDDE